MLAQEPVRVQHQRGHLDLTVGPAPGRPIAIGVELDPVALRVGEVERLADQVIRAAGVRARVPGGDRVDRRGQVGLGVEQDRGVEQPGRARRRVLQLGGVDQPQHLLAPRPSTTSPPDDDSTLSVTASR